MPWNIPHPVVTETVVDVITRDRLFDELVTAIGGLSGLTMGLMAYGGSVPQINGNVWQVCFCENVEIVYKPSEILEAIVNKDGCVNGTGLWWPSRLTLTLIPVMRPMTVPRLAVLDGVRHLNSSICAHAFLTYYEKVKKLIIAKEKQKDGKNWISPTFRMAWIVRNAIGHGGKLTIDDSSVSANWRGLSFSSSNNHELLLYNHMTAGDLILLMLDVEDLLP